MNITSTQATSPAHHKTERNKHIRKALSLALCLALALCLLPRAAHAAGIAGSADVAVKVGDSVNLRYDCADMNGDATVTSGPLPAGLSLVSNVANNSFSVTGTCTELPDTVPKSVTISAPTTGGPKRLRSASPSTRPRPRFPATMT